MIPFFKLKKYDPGDIVIRKDGPNPNGYIACVGAFKFISAKDKLKIKVRELMQDELQSWEEQKELKEQNESLFLELSNSRSLLLPGKTFGDFKSISSHAYKRGTVIALEESKAIIAPVELIIKYIEVSTLCRN